MTIAQLFSLVGSNQRLVCYVFALVASSAPAPAASAQVMAASRAPRARLWSFSGEARQAEVVAVSEKEIVCRSKTLSTRDVYRVDFGTPRFDVPNRPTTAVVQLVNRDELYLRRLACTEEVLSGTLGDQRVKVPLEFVRAVVFGDGASRSARKAMRAAFARGDNQEDIVGLADGDRLVGEFLAIDGGDLLINVADAPRKVPGKRLAFLRFSSQLLSELPAAELQVTCELSGGSVLTGNRFSMRRGDGVRLQTSWGANIVVPDRRVHAVRFLGNRIEPLSGRPPTVAKHAPFAGRQREFHLNRTINADRATHGGNRYYNCIGVTSGMTLTWQLDGAFTQFHSRFGIDDSASGGGAVFLVLVDGKERYRSTTQASGQQPGFTGSVDVTHARTLTLSVEYGPRGDMQDVANWLDPLLIRR